MPEIIYVKTEEEFNKLKDIDKLILIKFGASWCGPCKQVKPHLEKIAESESNLIIVDIDVEETSEWEWNYDDLGSKPSEVETLPTFRFIKYGVQVEEYSGSKMDKIKDMIKTLLEE
jgi:thioredoxin 1